MSRRYRIDVLFSEEENNEPAVIEGILDEDFIKEEFSKFFPNATIVVRTRENEDEDWASPLFVCENGSDNKETDDP